jgi:uncharacterized membrane protein (DUF106 family)
VAFALTIIVCDPSHSSPLSLALYLLLLGLLAYAASSLTVINSSLAPIFLARAHLPHLRQLIGPVSIFLDFISTLDTQFLINQTTMDATRTILNEHDMSWRERHSFDDLTAILYPKADNITDHMRSHLMMEVFFE